MQRCNSAMQQASERGAAGERHHAAGGAMRTEAQNASAMTASPP
jgi:hypothetical protein